MSKCTRDEDFRNLWSVTRLYKRWLPSLLPQVNSTSVDFSRLNKHFGISNDFQGSTWTPSLNKQESRKSLEIGESRACWTETIITEEEVKISEKLHRCCNAFGEEREEKLSESAACLLELGRLYQTYAINSKGTKQKLNFIKSAALMTGAIVRYTKIKKSKGLELAKKELRALHQKLLKLDCVKGNQSTNILALNEELKCLLEHYRRKIEEKLKKIVQIRDDEGEEDTLHDEQTKVVDIRNICEQITEHYIDIMKEIAHNCELIMGPAPCQFAIVGLGSLAKKEVTLYSDFEHAIVLEDGLDEDSPMKEYFRWFTTIFHIFVVGLGETVIPSVDIRSLCNLYSDDKTEKWFSDHVTPCGISFDGMMAHACKFPLGRQNEAKHRKNFVELIQPVKMMANYLTQEEELKMAIFSAMFSADLVLCSEAKKFMALFVSSQSAYSSK